MRRLLICLAFAGCARAGKENSIIGGLTDAGARSDALDAPPGQTTLSQTTSDAVALGTSQLGCEGTMGTNENSYYRVFTLADHGIAATLHVTQVSFGIDTATAGAGSGGKQPGTVRIGSYGSAPGTMLDLAMARTINAVDIQIPDGSATAMTVPITADVAPTANMIVELFIPDGDAAGNKFKIGANASGERKPGYLRAPDCDVLDPATMESLSPGKEIDLILSVTGTTDAPS